MDCNLVNIYENYFMNTTFYNFVFIFAQTSKALDMNLKKVRFISKPII